MTALEQIIIYYFNNYFFSCGCNNLKRRIRIVVEDCIAKEIALRLLNYELNFSYTKISDKCLRKVLGIFFKKISETETHNINCILKKNGYQRSRWKFITRVLENKSHLFTFPIRQLISKQIHKAKWLNYCRLNHKILGYINEFLKGDFSLINWDKRILFAIALLMETDVPLAELNFYITSFCIDTNPTNIPSTIPVKPVDLPVFEHNDIVICDSLDATVMNICKNINSAAEKTRAFHGFFRKMQKPYQKNYPARQRKKRQALKKYRIKYQQYYEYNALLITALQLLEILLRDMAEFYGTNDKNIVQIYKGLSSQNKISKNCEIVLKTLLSSDGLNLRNRVQHGALILPDIQRREVIFNPYDFEKKAHSLINYFYAVVDAINTLLTFYPKSFNHRTWHHDFLLSKDEISQLEDLEDYFFVGNFERLLEKQKQMSNFINTIIPCSTLAKLPCCSVRNKSEFDSILLFSFFPSVFEQIFRNMCLYYLRIPIVDPPGVCLPLRFRYTLLDKSHLARESNVINLLNVISRRYDLGIELKRLYLLIKVRDAFAHGALLFQRDDKLHNILHRVFVNEFFIFSEIGQCYPKNKEFDINIIY